MRERHSYTLRLRIELTSKMTYASRCGCCDFFSLCSTASGFDPYACGFSQEMARRIVMSGMYFKISRWYEKI